MSVYIKFIALVYGVNCIGYIVTYSAWAKYYDCAIVSCYIYNKKISLYECFIIHTFH